MASNSKQRDRGGGIHIVRRSDFRLRDIHLSFDATTGDLVDSSMIPELRTDIFDEWLRIAEGAAADSEAARDDAVAAPLDDGEGFTRAVLREFEASIIAIAASAFAIDAFFASVVEHAPGARVSAGSRAGTILETLRRAFALSAAQAKATRGPLRSIFQFRDLAVHSPAAWAEPVRHPAFNVGMEPRFVRFRAENAINAQRFASKLIALCVRQPSEKYPGLVEWSKPLPEVVPDPPPVPDWAMADETEAS